MSDLEFTLPAGERVRLMTAGKYCDRNITVTAEGGGVQLPTLTDPAGENDVRLGKEYIDGGGVRRYGALHMDTVLTPDWSDRVPVAVQYDSDDRYLVMKRLPAGGGAETLSATITLWGSGGTAYYTGESGAAAKVLQNGDNAITVAKGTPVAIVYQGGTYLVHRTYSGAEVLVDTSSTALGVSVCVVAFTAEGGSIMLEEA